MKVEPISDSDLADLDHLMREGDMPPRPWKADGADILDAKGHEILDGDYSGGRWFATGDTAMMLVALVNAWPGIRAALIDRKRLREGLRELAERK